MVIEKVRLVLYTPFGVADCDARAWPESPDLPITYCCWLKETGENWEFPQQLVRAAESMSTPRHGKPTGIYLSDELFETYKVHILRHKESPFYERAVKGIF